MRMHACGERRRRRPASGGTSGRVDERETPLSRRMSDTRDGAARGGAGKRQRDDTPLFSTRSSSWAFGEVSLRKATSTPSGLRLMVL